MGSLAFPGLRVNIVLLCHIALRKLVAQYVVCDNAVMAQIASEALNVFVWV